MLIILDTIETKPFLVSGDYPLYGTNIIARTFFSKDTLISSSEVAPHVLIFIWFIFHVLVYSQCKGSSQPHTRAFKEGKEGVYVEELPYIK